VAVETSRPTGAGWTWQGPRRTLEHYPATRVRVVQMGLVVLVTTGLYYESYVGGSVSTLLLAHLHLSFTFYVSSIAIGNLLGAVGSWAAGLADRVSRANLVVGGLLLTGLGTLFAIPAVTSRWPFVVVSFLIGLVEGVVLVATPALVRDFSPQTGRATAMAFWTTGPVLGSLVVSGVGSATINAHTHWQHEYRICGAVGLVVFVVAFVGLRELAPRLRDQVMVSTQDQVLLEARARGLDLEASMRNPWRQMVKPEILLAALGISVFLLVYYTAVAFGTIVSTTVLGFSLRDANGLANWQWGADAVALVAIGVLSDRLRVRKPLMVIGALGGAVMLALLLLQFDHQIGYYRYAGLLALTSVFFSFGYAPWLASFTETLEARNPALMATGLAVWGGVLRVVVFAAFLVLPHIVTTVGPLVTYGPTVATDAKADATELAFVQAHPQLVAYARSHQSLLDFATSHAALITFAETHPTIVATAVKDTAQLAAAQKFAPELAVIAAHPALFTQLATYPDSADIPPALLTAAITACGGGERGLTILETIGSNAQAIDGVVAVAPELRSLAPYAAQLTALGKDANQFAELQADQAQLAAVQTYAAQLRAVAKVAPSLTYLQAHGVAVLAAKHRTAAQWRTWYWVCVGGALLFLLSVPLLRGRWSPRRARADAAEHAAQLAREASQL
jgi:ACS family D-galactonate transporter-like MFS transporter